MDPILIKKLIDDYNSDPTRYNDNEAETIAALANAMGKTYKRESRVLEKGLFDLTDTATLGLIPNEWRPVSRGDSVYGDSNREQMGSGLGMLAGALGSGAVVAKGLSGVSKGARGILDNLKHKMRRGTRSSMYDNQLRLGSGSPLPPEPTRLLNVKRRPNLLQGSQFSKDLKRNRFPINQFTGQPIQLGGQRPPIRLGGQRQLQLGPSTLLDNYSDYLYSRVNTPFVDSYGRNL